VSEQRMPRWLALVAAAIGFFLLVPTLIVVPLSFSSARFLEFPPPGFSVEWYENFANSPNWTNAAWNSLKIGLAAAALSTVLGTACALGVQRANVRAKGVLNAIVIAPMVVPVVVIAVGTYDVFARWGLAGTFAGLVIGHTVLAMPFVYVTVGSGLRTFDRSLERAALTLGASPMSVLWRITLPLLAPHIAIGALFAFITSWDEVVVSVFLSSPFLRTLPIEMFNQLETNLDPTIAAVATLLMAVTTMILAAVAVLRARQSVRRPTGGNP